MKISAIALAAAFALSGTAAFANTVHHKVAVTTDRAATGMVQLHPNYGNPNGNPDGPTTLSGTGNSLVRWLVARHQRLQLTAAAGSRSANGGTRKLLRRDLAAEAMDDMAIAETSDLPRLILRLDLSGSVPRAGR